MCRIIDETKKVAISDSETDKTRWDSNDRRTFEKLVDSVTKYLTNEKRQIMEDLKNQYGPKKKKTKKIEIDIKKLKTADRDKKNKKSTE